MFLGLTLAFLLMFPGFAQAPDERLIALLPAAAVDRVAHEGLIEDYGGFQIVVLRASEFARARAAGIPAEDLTLLFSNGLIAAAQRTTIAQGAYVVQFVGPVKSAWTTALAAAGASPSHYVGAFAFAVAMDETTAVRAAALPYVRQVLPYPAEGRLDYTLREASGVIEVDVVTFRHRGPEVAQQLPDRASVWWQRSFLFGDVLRVHLPAGALEDVAVLPYVTWVAPVPRGGPLLPEATWVVQSNTPDVRSIWTQGLRGEGQLVALADTGLQDSHVAFYDPAYPTAQISDPPGSLPPDPNHRKIANYHVFPPAGDADDFGGIFSEGHGTSVGSAIAGDNVPNGLDGSANGIAPASRLVVEDVASTSAQDFDSNVTDLLNVSYNDGARLHSNSWGRTTGAGQYAIESAEADAFLWTHPDFLAFFAAGNEGPGMSSIRPPGTAKNIVTVGASENGAAAEQVWVDSSRGPTADGRLKPTVVAPTNVYAAHIDSTPPYDFYLGPIGGTSLSTPLVSGAGALIRQYFLEGFYPLGYRRADRTLAPSGALIKAMLINSGDEMNGLGAYDLPYNGMTWPSNDQGWGRVLLDDAMYFRGDARRLYVRDDGVGLATGETWETSVVVLDETQPLKITLVWSDYPGTPGGVASDPELVNDLDLEVLDPNGFTYYGNVFTGFDPVVSLPNAGAPDRRNVEEQVIFPSGWNFAGTFTIRVRGFNVPQGAQRFALVVTGAIDGPDNVPPPAPTLLGTDLANGGNDVALSWAAAADDGLPGGATAYEVFRSDAFDRNGTGYMRVGQVAATGQANYVYTDANAGMSDVLDHFYFVRANDSEGNVGPWIGQGAKLRLPVAAGRSLLSHPLLVINATWALGMAAVGLTAAWRYDASDALDPWKSWSLVKGGGDLPAAAPLPARGLWVESTAAGNVTVAGLVPDVVGVPLVAGWNLVGYGSLSPGTVGDVRAAAGCTVAQGFDASPPYRLRLLADADSVGPGSALWLRCPAASVLPFTNG